MNYKPVKDSQIEISELMLPSHSNFSGKIHGGYILNLMDQIAFACASKHSKAYCVTASVNTVNFLNPVEVGELITMKASVNFVGRSSMVVGIRVEAENIKTGVTKHCNSSYFTMVAKDDDGKSIVVPNLELKTNEEAKRFLRAKYRRETKAKRSEKFNHEFNHINHLDELNSINVKLSIPNT